MRKNCGDDKRGGIVELIRACRVDYRTRNNGWDTKKGRTVELIRAAKNGRID
jgi:hypothetical protein